MLYVLYGSDVVKGRLKVNALVKTLLSKKPDATFVRVTGEECTPQYLEACIGGQGLFESKLIVVFDSLLAEKDIREHVEGVIPELGASPNIFILFEEKIEKKLLTKLEKHAEKVQVCDVKERVQKKEAVFNVFTLSDALGKRDSKVLWTLYQKGRLSHMAPEEMHGILMWGVRAMLLAHDREGPKDTGLHPFAYRKAAAFAQNYSKDELRELSKRLLSVYHEARRGTVVFDIALERLILSL